MADRDLHFHIAIIGGGALLLRYGSARPTQDVDVVASAAGSSALKSTFQLPDELVEAAEDVAFALGLDDDWINAGALGVLAGKLPAGYQQRLTTETFGNLAVSALSRQDLVRLKLYAAADEGPGSVHLQDVIRMSVTREELDDAASWVASLYPSDTIPELEEIMALLRRLVR